jgi:hypothetical protein
MHNLAAEHSAKNLAAEHSAKNLAAAHSAKLARALALVVSALVIGSSGCVDLVIPPDAAIACGADGSCPGDTVCNDVIDRCVPRTPPETDPPALSAVSIDPPAAKAGDVVTVAVTVDEALAVAPVVAIDDLRLTGAGDVDVGGTFTFTHTVSGDEDEGLRAVRALVVDVYGNADDVAIGRVEFDFTAPVITDPNLDDTITNARLRFRLAVAGATRLRVTGDVDAALDVAVVGGSVDVDVVLSDGDGVKSLLLTAEDAVANATTLPLSLNLVTTPTSTPSLLLPAGQSAVKDNDVVAVGGSVSAGATLVSARLLADDNSVLDDDVSDAVTVNAAGAVSGTLALGVLGVTPRVRLEVIVTQNDVESAPGASRSNPLPVDNRAPDDATCALPAVVGDAQTTMLLGALDFVDVAIGGDAVAQDFGPLVGDSRTVVLTGGDGTNTVTATFRDGAHNLTTCSATTVLDPSAPAVLTLTLAPPAGQIDVKDGDVVDVSATLDISGATIARATLTDGFGEAIGDANNLTVVDDTVVGSFVVGGPKFTSTTSEIALELVVNDGVRNSAPLRSNFLVVDDVPPTAPVVTAPADSASFDVDVDIAGCVGATSVAVSGDVSANNGVFVPFTAPTTTLTVTLSPGVGDKDLTVVCRDNAFQLSTPATVTVALSTDDVLSQPTLVLPPLGGSFGATAMRNGVAVGVGGVGEPGATVQSVRLIDAGGATVQTFATSAVTVGVDGSFAGSLTPTALVDGTAVRLEIVLFARGRASVAANSRSAAVDVDLTAPVAPDASALRMAEVLSELFTLDSVDDIPGLFLAGDAGAVEPNALVEIAVDAAFGSVGFRNRAGATGAFTGVNIGAANVKQLFVRTIDGAGNVSPTTIIEAPTLAFATIDRPRAAIGDTITFTVDCSVPFVSPAVLVDGENATFVSQTATSFVFAYDVTGSEPEGPLVVRAFASHAAQAPASTGIGVAVVTVDFTAPAIDRAQVVVAERAPGTNDTVAGNAAVVVDEDGADVDVAIVETGDTFVLSSGAAFAARSLGDNARATFTLRATDDAGNVASEVFTNDIAAPVIRAGDVALVQSDPGTADRISGAAGAVDDNGTFTLTVAGNAVSVAGNGSFGPVSLGDNVVAVVNVVAVDAAGNSATLTLANDIAAPVLSAITTFAALADGDTGAISFAVDDTSALRATPGVTVGARAATRVSGNAAEVPQSETHAFSFVASSVVDVEGGVTVAINVVDAAGNVASATRGAVLDFTDPLVRNVTPGDRLVWDARAPIAGTVDGTGTGVGLVVVNVQECTTPTDPCDGLFFDAATGAFDAATAPDLDVDVDATGVLGNAWSLPGLAATAYTNDFFYEVSVDALDDVANFSSVVRRFEFQDAARPTISDLVATRVGSDVTLTWQNGVAGDRHLVHYATSTNSPPYSGVGLVAGDSPIAVGDGTATSFVLTGLPAGSYFFNVTGALLADEGGYAREVRVIVP